MVEWKTMEMLECDKEDTEQEIKRVNEAIEETRKGVINFDKLSCRDEVKTLIIQKLEKEKQANEQLLEETENAILYIK